MKKVHQIVAGYANNDAISNEARYFRKILRKNGYASEIYCPSKNIGILVKDGIDLSKCNPDPNDIVILHLSIGSPANFFFKDLKCKKVILYHNVTPAHFFRFINEETAAILAQGEEQVKMLADTADINLADSNFNALELSRIGYKKVDVLPIIIDFKKLSISPSRYTVKQTKDDIKNILFVGRCAPNKKIEDIITAFHIYRKTENENARLILAGSYDGYERYLYMLKDYARKLNVYDHVYFTGSVPQKVLNAYYKTADLFLCMSEHEGFCIPLIEAMKNEIPILAYEAAAVPETLDGASVTFAEKDYRQISVMIDKLLNNQNFRHQIITAQNKRVEKLQNLNLEKKLLTIVNSC